MAKMFTIYRNASFRQIESDLDRESIELGVSKAMIITKVLHEHFGHSVTFEDLKDEGKQSASKKAQVRRQKLAQLDKILKDHPELAK